MKALTFECVISYSNVSIYVLSRKYTLVDTCISIYKHKLPMSYNEASWSYKQVHGIVVCYTVWHCTYTCNSWSPFWVNTCLRYIPANWSEGCIVPLNNKGDTDDVCNNRGITLLSTFGKPFTKVLNDRLNVWAEKYHVYIEAQACFRQHMGTVDNSFVFHGLITHIYLKTRKHYTLHL